jgi:hypothetical protein
MKTAPFFLLLFLLAGSLFGQVSLVNSDTTWRTTITAGFNFNQASFSGNWRAGGVNSVALGSLFNLRADYEKGRLDWDNSIDLLYGMTNNRGQGFRKTTDRIFLDSKLGYKLSDKWNMFLSGNFLSQFAPGYRYEKDLLDRERSINISDFMTPAFLMFAYGFEYKPAEYFYVRFSPFAPVLPLLLTRPCT